ncbi:Zinc finger BED domain-containing protein 4 [Puccinia graminis f. sp. tritici]|uniref:Zinc finger BED domain-containing protein 4 n=1 Tax=Puccinia graminis f. sp. tritici TaxID=56615 RepID=A0A5B0QVN4_PUCGR|nr:Zinc finger BED domain-containing protein 4 [Puccinia graminis f. sp. tritici]
MLKRASKLQSCISAFCEKYDEYNLEPHEWLKLDQLCNFMGLLYDATNTISPENTVTLLLAAPVYIMMMKELHETTTRYNAQDLIPSAIEMLNKLRGYFNAAIKKPVYLCATLLDPRIKEGLLDRPGVLETLNLTKETILENFKIEAQKFTSDRYNEDQTNDNPNSNTPQNTFKSSIFTKKRRKITSLNNEIKDYFASETEDKSCDPLLYWKANSTQLPSLANMTRKFLAVPASREGFLCRPSHTRLHTKSHVHQNP